MLAAVITRPGGPEVLEVRDVSRPLPREHEILVRVRATALNRADLLQRAGRYAAPPGVPADIPGLEFAGEVAEAGRAVTRWSPGDRVFGIVGGGGHAEYLVTHELEAAPVPAGLSWEEAAAVPEAFITAHDALVTQGGLCAGEMVLVHAIGSGVGLAAVQLVHALGGQCFGTARTPGKIARAHELGLADGAALDDPAALPEVVRRWAPHGVNLALDLAGGDYLAATVRCMAPRGRVILVGLLAGSTATLDLATVLSQRLVIRGTVLRSRSAKEKAEATAAFARDVLPLIARGAVRPVVDRVFALEQVQAAHALLDSNQTFGKLVLRLPDAS